MASAGTSADRPCALVRLHLLVEVANGAVDALRQTPEAAPLAAPEGDHLPLDRIGVLGHLGGQIDDLPFEEVAEPGDGGERDQDDDGHCRDAAERALEEPDRGTERESHHDRQRQRNEDRLRARENGDDQHHGAERAQARPIRARRRRGRVLLAEAALTGSKVPTGIGGSPGTR